jgi:hypothetical protein
MKTENKKGRKPFFNFLILLCFALAKIEGNCIKGGCPQNGLPGPRGPTGLCPSFSMEGNMTVTDGTTCGVSKLVSTSSNPHVRIGASWALTTIFGPLVDIPSLEDTQDVLNTSFVVQDNLTGRLKRLNTSTGDVSCTCTGPTETIIQRNDQTLQINLTSTDTTYQEIPGLSEFVDASDFDLLSTGGAVPEGSLCGSSPSLQCQAGLVCCGFSIPGTSGSWGTCVAPTSFGLNCRETRVTLQVAATVQLTVEPTSGTLPNETFGSTVEIAFFVNGTIQNPPFEFSMADSTDVDGTVFASLVLTLENLTLSSGILVDVRIRYAGKPHESSLDGLVVVGSAILDDPDHGVLNTIGSLASVGNVSVSDLLICQCTAVSTNDVATERVVGSFLKNSSVVCGNTSTIVASLSFESDGSSHLSASAFGSLNLTSLGTALQIRILLDDFSVLTSETFQSTTSNGLRTHFYSQTVTTGTLSSDSHTISLVCTLTGGTAGTGIVSASPNDQAQLNFFLLPL